MEFIFPWLFINSEIINENFSLFDRNECWLVLTTCALANEPSAVSPTVISLPTGPGNDTRAWRGFNTQLNTGTSQDKLNFGTNGRNQMTLVSLLTTVVMAMVWSAMGDAWACLIYNVKPWMAREVTALATPMFCESWRARARSYWKQWIPRQNWRAICKIPKITLMAGRPALANGSVWLLGQNSNAQHHDKRYEQRFSVVYREHDRYSW